MYENQNGPSSWVVCIGLAQMVERLTHRYSESTSLNPGNLTSATVCGDRTGGNAGHQEISNCSTRGGSQGINIMFTSAMRIRQPTLALKPRRDITKNPKQGYQWPQKGHVYRPNFKKRSFHWCICSFARYVNSCTLINLNLPYILEPIPRRCRFRFHNRFL